MLSEVSYQVKEKKGKKTKGTNFFFFFFGSVTCLILGVCSLEGGVSERTLQIGRLGLGIQPIL